MPYSVVDEINSGLTRVNHETVSELHRFGAGGTKLSGDNNFATLGAGLHNKT
jgi:hypothetical protein